MTYKLQVLCTATLTAICDDCGERHPGLASRLNLEASGDTAVSAQTVLRTQVSEKRWLLFPLTGKTRCPECREHLRKRKRRRGSNPNHP